MLDIGYCVNNVAGEFIYINTGEFIYINTCYSLVYKFNYVYCKITQLLNMLKRENFW